MLRNGITGDAAVDLASRKDAQELGSRAMINNDIALAWNPLFSTSPATVYGSCRKLVDVDPKQDISTLHYAG